MKNYDEIKKNGFGTFHYLEGKLHRTDGPAIEYADGHKEWYINGKRHREDGPAVEYFNGDKLWYINGQLHRTDGPAIEFANGYKEWWINGVRYSRTEYYHKLKLLNCPEYMK